MEQIPPSLFHRHYIWSFFFFFCSPICLEECVILYRLTVLIALWPKCLEFALFSWCCESWLLVSPLEVWRCPGEGAAVTAALWGLKGHVIVFFSSFVATLSPSRLYSGRCSCFRSHYRELWLRIQVFFTQVPTRLTGRILVKEFKTLLQYQRFFFVTTKVKWCNCVHLAWCFVLVQN